MNDNPVTSLLNGARIALEATQELLLQGDNVPPACRSSLGLIRHDLNNFMRQWFPTVATSGGYEDPGTNQVQHLSMPDPPGTTRIDVIRDKLGDDR